MTVLSVTAVDPGPPEVAFERPAELVEISEHVYCQIFAVGLWVAAGFTAFAALASLLQPAGSQLPGLAVCTVALGVVVTCARSPAVVYQALRRRPSTLLAPGALLGLGAVLIGPDNYQLSLPILSIIGVAGIATPRPAVIASALLAAIGVGASRLIDGQHDLGGAVVLVVLPLIFWVIVERVAGFGLRFHQSLASQAVSAAPPDDEAARATGGTSGGGSTAERPSQNDASNLELAEPPVILVDSIRLSSRQLQVVLLACEGLQHAEIGACLGIGAQQVRRHLGEARRRTQSQTTPQLIAWARKTGLVPLASATRKP
ncbi:MAG: hypothetical protein Q8K55_03550 [Gemmatimonadaceae bacterium]|nr:hypothetical protein [Gemmatimonadaceae bacterium]